jgi:type I restriction enzyme S subunit
MSESRDWTSIRVGHLFSARQSLDPSRYPDEVFDLLSIPAYDAGEPEVIAGSEIGSNKLRVSPSDTLVSRIIPHIQRVWVVPEPGNRRQIASSEWMVLRSELSDPRFLRYALLDSRFHAEFMATVDGLSGSLQRARLQAVKQIALALPSLEEQRAIADYLDRETAQIDAFIAKNEELIALLIERRSAEISLATSGDWPEVQLRTLSRVPIQNGVDAIGDPSNPHEWPRYVRTTDIANVASLDPEKRVTIAPELAKAGLVEQDDVLMTRAGATIGKSYLHASGEVASYAGYLVRIRPDRRRVLPWYLAYWTQSQGYLDQIRSGAVVSTIENFSASKYRALKVPLPPIDVQLEIVNRIRRSSENANLATRKATTAIELARERRAALISAAVTGKIDVEVAA